MTPLVLLVLLPAVQEDRSGNLLGFGAGAGGRLGGGHRLHASEPRILHGRIVDAEGLPVPNLRIDADCCKRPAPDSSAMTAATDADGRFLLEGTWGRRFDIEYRSEGEESLQSTGSFFWDESKDLDAEWRANWYSRPVAAKVRTPDGELRAAPLLLERSSTGRWWRAEDLELPSHNAGFSGTLRGLQEGRYQAYVATPLGRWLDAGVVQIPQDLGSTLELDQPGLQVHDWKTLLRAGGVVTSLEDRFRILSGSIYRESSPADPVHEGEHTVAIEDPFLRVVDSVIVRPDRAVLLPVEARGVLQVPIPAALQALVERKKPYRIHLRILGPDGLRITDHRCPTTEDSGWLLEKVPVGEVQILVWEDAESVDDRAALQSTVWRATATVRAGEHGSVQWSDDSLFPKADFVSAELAASRPVERLRDWEYLPLRP
ncbi:MAG TPA: carboxypeptidase-like regulatory domain-containing protein [Planctomycetota bacterium]